MSFVKRSPWLRATAVACDILDRRLRLETD
jgi:hypothetical protein